MKYRSVHFVVLLFAATSNSTGQTSWVHNLQNPNLQVQVITSDPSLALELADTFTPFPFTQAFLDTREVLYRRVKEPNCHALYQKVNCQDPSPVASVVAVESFDPSTGTTERLLSWPEVPLVLNSPSSTAIWSQNVHFVNFDRFQGWLYLLITIDEILVGNAQSIDPNCSECVCPIAPGTAVCELVFTGGPRLETTFLKVTGFPSQLDLFVPKPLPPCPEGDGDGFADCTAIPRCDPFGHLCSDCDDSDASVNPRADESGKRAHDGIDNDCNGVVDG